MRFSHLFALFLFAVSFAFAVERIGTPVSPSLWDSYLPNSTHPSYASNLGALQEGRLTFGFQDADLAHLSLSIPGLQIISANTKWQTKANQERWFYDFKNVSMAENGYYRDFFLVAGGGRLSNILSLKNWDLGVGLTFKSLSVENEDSKKFWQDNRLGASFSFAINSVLFSGAWDKYEQRYLVAYNEPGNWQAGIEFYQSYEDFSSFGIQPGAELIFYESLKFHSGIRWQFAESIPNDLLRRVEFMFNSGVSLRFRPWREGIDPKWLHPFIAPFNAAIFYDWEFSFDANVDVKYNAYNWLISLSKWF